MSKYSFSRGAVTAAALLILGPSVTSAEPALNANIWGGQDHEPAPSQVQQKGQVAGIAPTTQQPTDRELESLYRSLIKGTSP